MRQRVCSRLLKIFADAKALNERPYEQDVQIMNEKIDACLPLVDPMKEAAANKKKAKQKQGQGKAAGKKEESKAKGKK